MEPQKGGVVIYIYNSQNFYLPINAQSYTRLAGYPRCSYRQRELLEAEGFSFYIARMNMSLIKSKDTSIEIIFRKALWKAGFRYRKNYKKLPGKPDIALTKQKIAIFCDGEFWHGKNWDEDKEKIKSNRKYWFPKIDKNIKRDFETDRDLKLMGWEVLRFWGADIEKNLASCIEQVREMVFYREIEVEP